MAGDAELARVLQRAPGAARITNLLG